MSIVARGMLGVGCPTVATNSPLSPTQSVITPRNLALWMITILTNKTKIPCQYQCYTAKTPTSSDD